MSIKHTNKVRVNVTMSPAILTRIDKAVGP